MMEKLKPYALLFAGLAVLASVWHYFRPARTAPVGVYAGTTESPEVANLEKQPIQGKVNVLPAAAKHKTKLPQTIQDDPGKHIVDTAQFPITSQPFTAVAVYDEKSGDIEMSVRNDPQPWLAAERRGYVRIGYGVKTKTGTVGQIAVGGNVVQIKSLHAGGSVEVFTDGTGYIGGHVEYQF
ncbi:MAG: hypothetical protein WC236_09670 [Gallionellaceae bacterium]|jgi:hypothetical protein